MLILNPVYSVLQLSEYRLFGLISYNTCIYHITVHISQCRINRTARSGSAYISYGTVYCFPAFQRALHVTGYQMTSC